jgi:DNA-binding GntR family transcriptional regulator
VTADLDFLDFLRGTIRTVWALELLLLLRRAAPQAWTPEALVREMRASTLVVDESLKRLESAGLLRKDGDGFSFAPASPTLAALAESTELRYRESPVRLINAIAAPSTAKLQTLADAFRVKGDER